MTSARSNPSALGLPDIIDLTLPESPSLHNRVNTSPTASGFIDISNSKTPSQHIWGELPNQDPDTMNTSSTVTHLSQRENLIPVPTTRKSKRVSSVTVFSDDSDDVYQAVQRLNRAVRNRKRRMTRRRKAISEEAGRQLHEATCKEEERQKLVGDLGKAKAENLLLKAENQKLKLAMGQWRSEVAAAEEKLEAANRSRQCPICYDNICDTVLPICAHEYCQSCIETHFETERSCRPGNDLTCPICRNFVGDYSEKNDNILIRLYR